jgi:hypothetical protein
VTTSVDARNGLQVNQVAGGTRLDFPTRQTYGRSLMVNLR